MRLFAYIAAASAALSSVYAGLEDAKYSTKLTAANFDSAISGKGALVAFFAPWCGHCKSLEPTWTKVAKDFQDEEGVLVGHLDADNADNRPVASRYGVKGYPTIKWFPADGSEPLDYSAPRTEDAFLDFINKESGTHRTAGGLLNMLAGRIPSLDTLVGTFLATSSEARSSILGQAKEMVAQLTSQKETANSKSAAYYIKVMEKLATSNEWAQNELARLQKLASKRGAMAGKQLDDLQIRQNILAAFTAMKGGASSVLSDASAAVESASTQVVASASSAADAAASAASSVSAQAASASVDGAKIVQEALSSGARAGSSVSANAEALASQASASIASASAAASEAAASAYHKVAGEL